MNKNSRVMIRMLRTFFSEYTMHWNTAYRSTKLLLADTLNFLLNYNPKGLYLVNPANPYTGKSLVTDRYL